MNNITPSVVASPYKLWVKVISGCVLGSCLGLILTNPHKETRHVNLNCQESQMPATLITSATETPSAECLLVQKVTRDASLWVY